MDQSAEVGARAEGPWGDLAIHSIGWKAFQDLCSQVIEEVLNRPVQLYREAQDGGQDAVFLAIRDGEHSDATIQCKYSSDKARRLKPSDITRELDSVKQLAAAGQADTYVLMTSMGVDAPVAVEIRNKLRGEGVKKPHVLGKEYLIRKIRSSARLRALVPQVYGLGDLSLIMDQRLIEQTRALLEQWIPKLDRYVPTAAHRNAVRALVDHGVVLLLGNPSTGKSTIGAILSTLATEEEGVTVIKLASPREFEDAWAPAEKKRFFWIDDAFGPNNLRDDFVQDWPGAFTKMHAAISQGNRFLLTSRRHIYEAAKIRLGGRNHPGFIGGDAVVDVGDLTDEEKSQILWNHIAFGKQTQSWKRSIKDQLAAAAAVDNFLPGIAERLGNPDFTKGLGTSAQEVVRFMREPKQHLIDTINALDPRQRAGLLLVYVHQGQLFSEDFKDDACKAVAELSDTALPRILDSLPELLGSFVTKLVSGGREMWTFAHPTIADALTTILGERSHMIAALLRGARIETILTGFICEGATGRIDAPVIPSTLNQLLVQRLLAAEDLPAVNRSVFSFLAFRASDEVLRMVVAENKAYLNRETWHSGRADYDPKIWVYAQAHHLGLLSPGQRQWAANYLRKCVIDDLDLAFLEIERILSLIPARQVLMIGFKLSAEILPRYEREIESVLDNADVDEDPADQFERITTGLRIIEQLPAEDGPTAALIETAQGAVRSAIADIERRREEKAEEEEDANEWTFIDAEPKKHAETPSVSNDTALRSIFSDVDR